jgi:hypothetical protein
MIINYLAYNLIQKLCFCLNINAVALFSGGPLAEILLRRCFLVLATLSCSTWPPPSCTTWPPRPTQPALRFTHRLITAPSCSTWCRGFGVLCAAAIRCAHLLVKLAPLSLLLFVLVSFGWLALRRGVFAAF